MRSVHGLPHEGIALGVSFQLGYYGDPSIPQDAVMCPCCQGYSRLLAASFPPEALQPRFFSGSRAQAPVLHLTGSGRWRCPERGRGPALPQRRPVPCPPGPPPTALPAVSTATTQASHTSPACRCSAADCLLPQVWLQDMPARR